jgi:hypothetical protein
MMHLFNSHIELNDLQGPDYFDAAGFEGLAVGFEDFSAVLDDFASGFVAFGDTAGPASTLISSTSKMRAAFGGMGPAPFSP